MLCPSICNITPIVSRYTDLKIIIKNCPRPVVLMITYVSENVGKFKHYPVYLLEGNITIVAVSFDI